MLRSIYHVDASVMNFVGSYISKTASGAALADLLPSGKVSLAQNVKVNEAMGFGVCKAHLSLKTLACFTAYQEAAFQGAATAKQSRGTNGGLGKQFINARVLTMGRPVIYLRPLTPP